VLPQYKSYSEKTTIYRTLHLWFLLVSITIILFSPPSSYLFACKWSL